MALIMTRYEKDGTLFNIRRGQTDDGEPYYYWEDPVGQRSAFLPQKSIAEVIIDIEED